MGTVAGPGADDHFVLELVEVSDLGTVQGPYGLNGGPLELVEVSDLGTVSAAVNNGSWCWSL